RSPWEPVGPRSPAVPGTPGEPWGPVAPGAPGTARLLISLRNCVNCASKKSFITRCANWTTSVGSTLFPSAPRAPAGPWGPLWSDVAACAINYARAAIFVFLNVGGFTELPTSWNVIFLGRLRGLGRRRPVG